MCATYATDHCENDTSAYQNQTAGNQVPSDNVLCFVSIMYLEVHGRPNARVN